MSEFDAALARLSSGELKASEVRPLLLSMGSDIGFVDFAIFEALGGADEIEVESDGRRVYVSGRGRIPEKDVERRMKE